MTRRFGRDDLGCRYGLPHQLHILHESKRAKWERCLLCGKRFKWNKGHRERIDNAKYLKAHIRQFCQKWGATKRVYHKIYKPNETRIII